MYLVILKDKKKCKKIVSKSYLKCVFYKILNFCTCKEKLAIPLFMGLCELFTTTLLIFFTAAT